MREFVEVKNEESRVKALSDIYIYIYIFFFFIITFIVQDEYYMCMLFTINSEFRLCSGLGKSKKLWVKVTVCDWIMSFLLLLDFFIIKKNWHYFI